jgi:hypothetical protein
VVHSLNHGSAKYIEGLENRLGRMESLLRLSGLLSEDDDGKTDLGTLEKRLADKTARASTDGPAGHSPDVVTTSPAHSGNELPRESVQHTNAPSVASPESLAEAPQVDGNKKPEEEVEALSDMMCSLVTNNCGETRYIGWLLI